MKLEKNACKTPNDNFTNKLHYAADIFIKDLVHPSLFFKNLNTEKDT